jgi:hypothetical protein
MTLFKNKTHEEIWIDHHCHRCFQPDEYSRRELGRDTICPILAKALKTQRKPREWDRPHRPARMQDAYKCNEFQAQPQRYTRQPQQFEDVEMFKVEPQDTSFVPVEGWPDKPKKGKDVDHA